MGIHADLGVTPVINAATMYTALGGSLMPPEVLAAMTDAAGAFVDMHELHLAAGRRLATITRNEAALVTAGCAAALTVATLATRTDGDPARLPEFPGRDRVPYAVVMHAAHRIPYDRALALAGAQVRQIGDITQTYEWELEAAIGPETAAVLWIAGAHLPQVAIPLDRVVQIAHAHQIPVIVDAAAQLPPVENLWHFTTEVGADLAVFSGGKTLRGPQASGLLVGRADLVEAARQHSSPYQRWARAMKVGKEEIAGLVRAVERYVELDHAAEHAEWVRRVAHWDERLGNLPGVVTTREALNEAGQPIPRLHLAIADPGRAEAVLDHIATATPRVIVMAHRANQVARGLWISPDLLQGEEIEIVADTVAAALAATPLDRLGDRGRS